MNLSIDSQLSDQLIITLAKLRLLFSLNFYLKLINNNLIKVDNSSQKSIANQIATPLLLHQQYRSDNQKQQTVTIHQYQILYTHDIVIIIITTFYSNNKNILMMNPNSGSSRLIGFDKPRVWSIMNPLAVKTQSVNLGQGFPSWQPAEFYRKFLAEGVLNGNHQYVRSFGSLSYTQAIAQFHKKTFGQIDHQNSICTAQGGSEALFCIFLGLLDQGDEVILFDPSYDCYRPQVQMAGGKTIGVPLLPKFNQTKSEILAKIEKGVISDEKDEWQIDFQLFEKSLNEKTKIVLVNSPHNPTGKVFTNEQMARIAKIVQKYPRIIIIDDNVYEGYIYDDMFEKPLPKVAFQEGMADRTISVYSAGKIFSATGVRSGWVVAHPSLIKSVRSVHQYNVFCGYNIIQNALTHSLLEISKPESTYFKDNGNKLIGLRNLLVKELLSTPYDLTLWIPKGGHFVLVDISKVELQQKYLFDEQGKKRTKDYAFAYQLANENRVVCIPMSPFYGEQHSHLGEKYVRFAFCKSEEEILEASKRMKQQ